MRRDKECTCSQRGILSRCLLQKKGSCCLECCNLQITPPDQAKRGCKTPNAARVPSRQTRPASWNIYSAKKLISEVLDSASYPAAYCKVKCQGMRFTCIVTYYDYYWRPGSLSGQPNVERALSSQKQMQVAEITHLVSQNTYSDIA